MNDGGIISTVRDFFLEEVAQDRTSVPRSAISGNVRFEALRFQPGLGTAAAIGRARSVRHHPLEAEPTDLP
jgi:hypothetical protein